MPAAALSQPVNYVPRKRFTREEVDRLIRMGAFAGLRYELIDGDLLDKMGQQPPHAIAIRRANSLLVKAYGVDRVLVQLPMQAGVVDDKYSLPEPDLAVVKLGRIPLETRFKNRHPKGPEMELVMEVADSSLRQDLEVKRKIYARAGVKEYWVLDINGRRLIVHRQPHPDGAYGSVKRYRETDKYGDFAVADMLPLA